MNGLLVDYARVSIDEHDLAARRDTLAGLGIEPDRVYVEHGVRGPFVRDPGAAKRSRPPALATPTPPSSIGPPATVMLNLGGSVQDPSDPAGWLLFKVPAMIDRDRQKATLGRRHGVCARER
jgi:hypothetical protein